MRAPNDSQQEEADRELDAPHGKEGIEDGELTIFQRLYLLIRREVLDMPTEPFASCYVLEGIANDVESLDG